MIDLSILSSGMYLIKIKTLLNNSIIKEEYIDTSKFEKK